MSNLTNLIALRDSLLKHAQQIASLVDESGAGGALNEEQEQRAIFASLHVADSVVKSVAAIHGKTEDFAAHVAAVAKAEVEVTAEPESPAPHPDATAIQGVKTPTVAQADAAPETSHAEQLAAVPAAAAADEEKIAVSTAETPQGNIAKPED